MKIISLAMRGHLAATICLTAACTATSGLPAKNPRTAAPMPAAETGARHGEAIRVDAPRPGTVVAGTVEVSGRARGPWFFEGDFPLLVLDGRGEVVARHFASAREPWMTTDWVPFAATVTIAQPYAAGWGWLVLKKDNPSERRALDDEVRIPIFLQE